MQITLYHTGTPDNYLIKRLSNAHAINGAMRSGNNDSMSPVITVSGDIPENLNYAKIGERFYYIRNRVKNVTGLTEIQMHEDVLMSHYNTILDMQARVTRNPYGETYLPDTEMSTFGNKKTNIIAFPESLSDKGYYILATV